jgi:hypothetical protein
MLPTQPKRAADHSAKRAADSKKLEEEARAKKEAEAKETQVKAQQAQAAAQAQAQAKALQAQQAQAAKEAEAKQAQLKAQQVQAAAQAQALQAQQAQQAQAALQAQQAQAAAQANSNPKVAPQLPSKDDPFEAIRAFSTAKQESSQSAQQQQQQLLIQQQQQMLAQQQMAEDMAHLNPLQQQQLRQMIHNVQVELCVLIKLSQVLANTFAFLDYDAAALRRTRSATARRLQAAASAGHSE